MPFTWNTNLSGKINNDSVKEIKANADSAASTIGISPFSWSAEFLTVADAGASGANKKIKLDYMLELRQAIDYLDDNRNCDADYATYFNAENQTERTSYYTSYNTVENGSYDGVDDYGYNGTYRSAYYNNDCGTVGTSNSTYKSSDYSYHKSSLNNTFCEAYSF